MDGNPLVNWVTSGSRPRKGEKFAVFWNESNELWNQNPVTFFHIHKLRLHHFALMQFLTNVVHIMKRKIFAMLFVKINKKQLCYESSKIKVISWLWFHDFSHWICALFSDKKHCRICIGFKWPTIIKTLKKCSWK